MRQFYVLIVTLLIFVLWLVPPYLMVILKSPDPWGLLYIPLLGVTFAFGHLVHVNFHYLFDKNR